MECLADKIENRFEIKKKKRQNSCESFILKRKKESWDQKLKTT